MNIIFVITNSNNEDKSLTKIFYSHKLIKKNHCLLKISKLKSLAKLVVTNINSFKGINRQNTKIIALALTLKPHYLVIVFYKNPYI